MIGSCFLIGCLVGSFIIPRIADIKGRKPMFLLGLFLYIICVFGLLFSKNKALMYTFLVIGGISETGRYYVAYVYAIEIMPKRLQNEFGLIIFMSFATCKVITCLYFWVSASKNWANMAYTAIVLAIFNFILSFIILPESPRFLISKKRY
jgi:SP family xylose:H+ symportor-like MFS transporter